MKVCDSVDHVQPCICNQMFKKGDEFNFQAKDYEIESSPLLDDPCVQHCPKVVKENNQVNPKHIASLMSLKVPIIKLASTPTI